MYLYQKERKKKEKLIVYIILIFFLRFHVTGTNLVYAIQTYSVFYSVGI